MDDTEKRRRSKRLIELSDRKLEAFYARHIGQEAEVLFEKSARGKAMHGFTRNYIRVELPARIAREEYDNQLLRVALNGFNSKKNALLCAVTPQS